MRDFISIPKPSDYVGQPLLSFVYDDGSQNQCDVVIPYHLEYNIPLSIALVVQYLTLSNGTVLRAVANSFLNAQEKGVRYIGHTWNHPHLTALTPEDRHIEIDGSRKKFIDIGFRNVDMIIAPHNDWNETIAQEAEEAGYMLAAGIFNGGNYNPLPLNSNKHGQGGQYWLNRINASNPKTGEQVIAEIDASIAAGDWGIVMLHQLFDTDDGTDYNWTKTEAVKVFEYVSKKTKSEVLVINPGLAYRYMQGLGGYNEFRKNFVFRNSIKFN